MNSKNNQVGISFLIFAHVVGIVISTTMIFAVFVIITILEWKPQLVEWGIHSVKVCCW